MAGFEMTGLLVALLLGATCPNATPLTPTMRGIVAHRKVPHATATHLMAVTSHPLATKAALDTLARGGNAADAFIAAVLVQDVVLPGVTSTAGLANILYYDAKTKRITVIHGGFADAEDPARRYQDSDTQLGKSVFIPGAPAAYAMLSKNFGKRPFAELVEPAARIADEGFVLDELYGYVISDGETLLKKTAYGCDTYFKDGRLLGVGDTLRLPAVATTLRAYGADPSWFYHAPWAAKAVTIANANGGQLVVRDFETYAPDIGAPFRRRFMGNDLYVQGEGGMKLLATLGALERLRAGAREGAPVESAEALDRLIGVYQTTLDLPILRDRDALTAKSHVDMQPLIDEVVRNYSSGASSPARDGGTHSSAAVIIDGEGNMVVGTHTSESYPWSSGYFVDGILLAAAYPYGGAQSAAKTRMRFDPTSNTIVVRDGKLVAGLAVYGSGLTPADVQILDGLLARNLSARDAIDAPRVAYSPMDQEFLYADIRFPDDVLCASQLPLKRAVNEDLGFPTLITVDRGVINGVAPDNYFVQGTPAGM